MSIQEELQKVQFELKAPKGQFNKFGGFRYRSCEDILESVKPLLAKYNLTLTIEDDIVVVGDRIYVKATSTIYNKEGQTLHATAFAREPNEKKGMDEAQITGATSSYARKYSLNGLFAIDDTKDADTEEREREEKKAKEKSEKRDTLLLQLKRLGVDTSKLVAYYKKTTLAEVSDEELEQAIAKKEGK